MEYASGGGDHADRWSPQPTRAGSSLDWPNDKVQFWSVNKQEKVVERGGLSIISFQLEGLCNGLRQTVPRGLAPGKDTVAIIKKLLADFASISTGKLLKDLPTLSETSNPVDILVMAETLRTSVLVFLTPEEIAEHRGTIGFHAEQGTDAP